MIKKLKVNKHKTDSDVLMQLARIQAGTHKYSYRRHILVKRNYSEWNYVKLEYITDEDVKGLINENIALGFFKSNIIPDQVLDKINISQLTKNL